MRLPRGLHHIVYLFILLSDGGGDLHNEHNELPRSEPEMTEQEALNQAAFDGERKEKESMGHRNRGECYTLFFNSFLFLV